MKTTLKPSGASHYDLLLSDLSETEVACVRHALALYTRHSPVAGQILVSLHPVVERMLVPQKSLRELAADLRMLKERE